MNCSVRVISEPPIESAPEKVLLRDLEAELAMGAATALAATLCQLNLSCRPMAMFTPCPTALLMTARPASCSAPLPTRTPALSSPKPTPAVIALVRAFAATCFQLNLSWTPVAMPTS